MIFELTEIAELVPDEEDELATKLTMTADHVRDEVLIMTTEH